MKMAGKISTVTVLVGMLFLGKVAYAQEGTPNEMLYQAYESFQIVQACYENRKGYAAVYVNEAEYNSTKDKMRKIESALKPKIAGTTSDQLWGKAASANDSVFKGFATAKFQNNKDMCDLFKSDLMSMADTVLGKDLPKKSF